MKKRIHESVQTALQRGWNELGATVESFEDQLRRRFQDARRRVDTQQAKDEIQRAITDLGHRLQENGEALERRVEEGVRTVVGRVREPLAEELATLRGRAEELGRRIESQLRGKPGPKPPG